MNIRRETGKRTLVVESHYIARGNSRIFRRKRGDLEYEFDIGIHYIYITSASAGARVPSHAS